jgi:hypothetical protein
MLLSQRLFIEGWLQAEDPDRRLTHCTATAIPTGVRLPRASNVRARPKRDESTLTATTVLVRA